MGYWIFKLLQVLFFFFFLNVCVGTGSYMYMYVRELEEQGIETK